MQCDTESWWKSICEQVNHANKKEDETRVQETAQKSFTWNTYAIVEEFANVSVKDQTNIFGTAGHRSLLQLLNSAIL